MLNSVWAVLLSILIIGLAGQATAALPAPGIREELLESDRYMPQEILVKFKEVVEPETIARVVAKYQMTESPMSSGADFKRLMIPTGKTVMQMIHVLRKYPEVEYAEPNYLAQACSIPNDPYYPLQWNLDNAQYGGINMEGAWEMETGSPNVIVAILDTGVAYEDYNGYHLAPDLAQTHFVPGYDFVNDDAHPNDDNGHGTHIAGIIAQSTNNGIGAAGIAFNCSIMPIKVLGKYSEGTCADGVAALRWAVDHGANVINLSLTSSEPSQAWRDALAYAYERGVTVVAAAGNEGSGQVEYPAAYNDYVMAVGATQYDESVASYSNWGTALDLVAPGGNVVVDQNGDGHDDGIVQQTLSPNSLSDFEYRSVHGTSEAAAHVSGVAALLISHGVTNPRDVRGALQQTAEDHGAPGWDERYGWGTIDAAAALRWTPNTNNPPVVGVVNPSNGVEDVPLPMTCTSAWDPNSNHLIYKWDFGDGTTTRAGVPTTTHTYTTGEPGASVKYTVTLVVNDGHLDSTPATTTATIAGVNDSPVAKIGAGSIVATAGANDSPAAQTGTGLTGMINEPLTFDASASSDEEGIACYTWDFGDGIEETVTAPTTVHTYSKAGTFSVSLTVTDTYGTIAVSQCEALVTDDPAEGGGPASGFTGRSLLLLGIGGACTALLAVLSAVFIVLIPRLRKNGEKAKHAELGAPTITE